MKKLLIIGFVWPEPNSSAAGTRLLQIIKLFEKHQFDITFASAASETEYMTDFSASAIHCQKIVLNDDSFDDFIKKLHPDYVLFDRFLTEEQFGWRVLLQCPNAVRILDTEDLHFLRKARQIAVKEQRAFLEQDLFSQMAQREIASIYRCDFSLIISEFEMQLLQDVFRIDKNLLHYLPFLIDQTSISDHDLIPFSNRDGFVFIGNFYHDPNVDAVFYLKSTIWPLLKKHFPFAELRIFGSYMPQKIRDLHAAKDGFLVMGRAQNAYFEIQKSKIMLVPLRFGAGLKGKLIDAMICGTPSISSKIAAEGMNGILPWCGAIQDGIAAFVAAAIEHYQDENLWNTAQKNGISILENRFLTSKFELAFFEKLAFVTQNITKHREHNFVGTILQHHTMQSTKYLSKWIAQKTINNLNKSN